MAKYRTLEPVTFVWDGVVTSVATGRTLELTDEQVKSLSGKLALVENAVPSMFPDGTPIIDPTIVRTVPATPVAGEVVEVEKPKAPVNFNVPKPKSNS